MELISPADTKGHAVPDTDPAQRELAEPCTQVERAVDWIRHSAVTGQLAPGDRIIESELASTLHMSRTPIREAIRRLAGEGLVELLPNRGAAVSSWSADDLEEIFEVRAEMEGFIAELAATRITTPTLDRMFDLHRQMLGFATSTADDAWDEYAKVSNTFHGVLAEAAQNGRLATVVRGLQAVPLFHREFHRSSPETLSQSNLEHAEILRALQAGSPEWARAAATCHIHSTRELIAPSGRSHAIDS